MFQDAFKKLELNDVAQILDQIKEDLDTNFDPIETTILAGKTSFYPDYQILEIANHTVIPAIKRHVIYSPENWVVLNFTNEPIYKLNEQVPIEINDQNIAEYIRFFFTYVKGRHGKFNIIESVDDINWKENPPPQARKAISSMITPITLVPSPVGEKNKFHCSACMIFKNALFKSDIIVDEKGFVTLSNEELQIDDMPILDEVLGQ